MQYFSITKRAIVEETLSYLSSLSTILLEPTSLANILAEEGEESKKIKKDIYFFFFIASLALALNFSFALQGLSTDVSPFFMLLGIVFKIASLFLVITVISQLLHYFLMSSKKTGAKEGEQKELLLDNSGPSSRLSSERCRLVLLASLSPYIFCVSPLLLTIHFSSLASFLSFTLFLWSLVIFTLSIATLYRVKKRVVFLSLFKTISILVFFPLLFFMQLI